MTNYLPEKFKIYTLMGKLIGT